MRMMYNDYEISGTPDEFKEFFAEKKKVVKKKVAKPSPKKKVKTITIPVRTSKVGTAAKPANRKRMSEIHKIARRIKQEHPKMKYIDCLKKAVKEYNRK